MEDKKLQFPKDFLWGAATSAHQVEGGMNNDWTQWEKDNAERLATEASKRWEKWQQDKFPEMFRAENYISGRACDHYNRFEEDFDLAKAGGHNSHRFSIEWSRIEPEEGKFDDKEIEHYRKVILALRERGLEPFVTLWHFTDPIWIKDIGGWENKKTAEYFARYVERIVSSIKGVNFWMTFNEPNIYVGMGYVRGSQLPGKKNILKARKAFNNMVEAHKRAYQLIHKINKDASVGIAESGIYFQEKNKFFLNKIVKSLADYFWNRWFFKKTKGAHDFIGLNYYTRMFVGIGSGAKNTLSERSDLNWEIYPEGIYCLLKDFAKYRLPMYITENGIASANDSKKEKFIREHISWIKKAVNEGIDLRGYFYWSYLEIFEMVEMRGYWTKFGMIDIDFETLERKPRKSYYAYRDIIKESTK